MYCTTLPTTVRGKRNLMSKDSDWVSTVPIYTSTPAITRHHVLHTVGLVGFTSAYNHVGQPTVCNCLLLRQHNKWTANVHGDRVHGDRVHGDVQ